MSKLWLCTTTAELCRNQWLKDGNWRCWLLTCTSSTSTLRKTRSVYFLLSSVKTGAIARHGPHQVAVKSTTTLNRIKKNHQHRHLTLYAHETKKQPIKKKLVKLILYHFALTLGLLDLIFPGAAVVDNDDIAMIPSHYLRSCTRSDQIFTIWYSNT